MRRDGELLPRCIPAHRGVARIVPRRPRSQASPLCVVELSAQCATTMCPRCTRVDSHQNVKGGRSTAIPFHVVSLGLRIVACFSTEHTLHLTQHVMRMMRYTVRSPHSAREGHLTASLYFPRVSRGLTAPVLGDSACLRSTNHLNLSHRHTQCAANSQALQHGRCSNRVLPRQPSAGGRRVLASSDSPPRAPRCWKSTALLGLPATPVRAPSTRVYTHSLSEWGWDAQTYTHTSAQ